MHICDLGDLAQACLAWSDKFNGASVFLQTPCMGTGSLEAWCQYTGPPEACIHPETGSDMSWDQDQRPIHSLCAVNQTGIAPQRPAPPPWWVNSTADPGCRNLHCCGPMGGRSRNVLSPGQEGGAKRDSFEAVGQFCFLNNVNMQGNALLIRHHQRRALFRCPPPSDQIMISQNWRVVSPWNHFPGGPPWYTTCS